MAGENGSGQASGEVNFGYSAKTNKIGVSGWSKGNEVGNVSNTGVGERNEVTTTRASAAQARGFFGRLFG
ncbi:hypothetical protein M6B38_412600 [Iris pallida]|uniref:Uncharacterized protein n=1 Tax=Iris pallida TaxID=29817 RepID=A0AAX6FM25_IRIPA|nr:hypothetical protein M6B38_224585 [Iris pallida]KAJ6798261.1 hypothetical protein M6B38_214245 [Iris pallida]KAJ6798262.1 hypothetical protein M6B38_214250 [Iris pallida]KAJ6817388.1 hypothetical protein M6B38_412590 [Iris pallida]KAJ6817389.1 hypothetical protein M6B38_412595 [Iris pallida]